MIARPPEERTRLPKTQLQQFRDVFENLPLDGIYQSYTGGFRAILLTRMNRTFEIHQSRPTPHVG